VEREIVISSNKHVVYIDNKPSFTEFLFEDSIHHHLEGGWGIHKTEKHNCWFEEAFISDKCCFPFISSSNPNIVISPTYVEFSKQCSGFYFIDKLGN